MGRSQETNKKKEVRNKKQKKKKEKAKKKQARKESGKTTFDDMIAYVNEDGSISSTPPDEIDKEETNIEDIEISIPKKDKSEEPDPIHKGIVSFFNDSKGYGFIKDLDTQDSLFVHVKNLQEEIEEGNRVEFEVEQGPKGLIAKNVKIQR